MTLPTSMTELIDGYAGAGDKDALRRLWESQARQLIEVEEKLHVPDQIDRSKTLEEIQRYCRFKMTHIDKVLETMY